MSSCKIWHGNESSFENRKYNFKKNVWINFLEKYSIWFSLMFDYES